MMVKHNYEDLEALWSAAAPGPKKQGEVALLVLRASPADLPKGQDKISQPMHSQPSTIRFTPQGGVMGDRWKEGKDVGAQLSLTSLAVTKLVAGPKERWHLLGNNLVVDLDLSAVGLPVGTRLRLGTGEIEISALPHAPCDRFLARLGDAAHRWVGDEKHLSRHLRGRYAQITRAGEVSIGETITVVPR